MSDVPSFMVNMGETPEELDITSPLREDILKDEETPAAPAAPAEPVTPEPAKTGEEPVTPPQKPEENGGKQPEKEEPAGEDELNKMGDAKKKDLLGNEDPEKKEPEKEPEKPEEKKEPEKTEPEKKEEPKTPEKTPDLTKAVEKASDAVAAAKDTPTEKQTELMKAVKLSQSVPLIFVDNFPKMKEYELEDGSFNVDGYMQAYTKSLIMGIQKSLAGGPLSASVFGILHNAMKEEATTMSAEAERDEKATSILTKLQTDYPRLKTDKDLEEAFDDMLQGVIQKRNGRIAAGEKLEDLKFEDVEKILLRLIGTNSKSQPAPTTPVDDGEKTETLKGGGANLNNGTGKVVPVSEVDQDIDAMMRVKSKSLF